VVTDRQRVVRRVGTLLIVLMAAVLSLRGADPSERPIPQRIISLSPNITEILYALGLENHIVGVTDFCKYPPEAQEKTKVGTLLSPNLEVIISLKPDLIIMLPSYEKTRKNLESVGIRTLEVKNDTIRDVLDSIATIGAATGRTSESLELVKSIKAELARIAGEVAHEARPRVLFVVDHNPDTLQQIYAAGPGTFIDDMIVAAGGDNVLKHSIGTYPIISKEEIVSLNPEVILDASYTAKMASGIAAQDERRKRYQNLWKQLPSISAVKNGRVIVLEDPALMIPGSEIAKNVGYFNRLFHPGLVKTAPTRARD
jgi:iron complex transport system substrate-binding protein